MADPASRTASQADFTLQLAGQTTESVRVVGFTGDEGISRLYAFRVEIVSESATIAFDSVLGKPALLEIHSAGGSRFVHGIVRRFERTAQGSRLTHYAAEIVPVHWLLTRRSGSRIFQQNVCADMTPAGVIQKVFEAAGLTQDTFRLALSATYAAREYVVQYRETEFDFISRLMEDEGIFYFFEHTAAGHKMVIADSGVAHVVSAIDGECPFREPTGLVPERASVVSVRDAAEVQAGATRLKDFDFAKPKTNLTTTSVGDAFKALELSDYPGGYVEKNVGTARAKVRLEEQQCRKRVLQMSGDVRGLMPGFKFALVEHPDSTLNVEYLVTGVSHVARQPQGAEEESGGSAVSSYEAVLQTIPSGVPFRPARVTRKPRVDGTQTAIVVGPAGEEIYTDNYGRVKVQFHWDLAGSYDENSSCWIRASQPLAGGQYGMLFLPRVGQEVVVDFLEGDPDRPLIVGRVYNNEQMPAYALPDNKTRSYIKTNSTTGGGTNELMFEDKKDAEKILLFAQKDLHVRVTNDRVENVDHNRYVTVKESAFELIKQKKHSEITLDLNEKIGGKHSHETTGDYGVKVGGNHSNETTGKLYLKAGQDLVIESTAGVTLKCGGNFLRIDSTGVVLKGTLIKLNSGGAAGTASLVSLVAPEATIEADTATPGADTTFSAEPVTLEALAPPDGFEPPEVAPPEEVVTSWVEIEMVDEEGQPWRDEYYEITLPDGKVRKGYLDAKGQAHVLLPAADETKVSFPRLDAEAWEKRE